jgi:hypothetical protein
MLVFHSAAHGTVLLARQKPSRRSGGRTQTQTESDPPLVPDETDHQSVSTRIIRSFLDALSEKKDFEEIAERLRNELLQERAITEASLRRGLFGDEL